MIRITYIVESCLNLTFSIACLVLIFTNNLIVKINNSNTCTPLMTQLNESTDIFADFVLSNGRHQGYYHMHYISRSTNYVLAISLEKVRCETDHYWSGV